MFNVTSEVISTTIDRDYSGDVLTFLTDFIDYCNSYTTYGTPAKRFPLEDVRHEFDTILCVACTALVDMSDGVTPALVELKEDCSTDSVAVYATRYYCDDDTNELVSEDYAPRFIITCPEDLASLCGFISVNFCSDWFEE